MRGKKTACSIRQESFIQETRYPSCENNKTQMDRGLICLSEWLSSPEGSWVHDTPPAYPFPNLPPKGKLFCASCASLFTLLLLLFSSLYRKYPKHLSGESRRLPTCHLCQRDGDRTQLRAPHLGWGSQPHLGQMQYLTAWRAQHKSHRMAATEGAKQRHFSF